MSQSVQLEYCFFEGMWHPRSAPSTTCQSKSEVENRHTPLSSFLDINHTLQIHSNSMPLSPPPLESVCVPAAVGIFTAKKLKCFSFFPPSAEISQWIETCPCGRCGLISGCLFCFFTSLVPLMDVVWRVEGDGETEASRQNREAKEQTYNFSDYVVILVLPLTVSAAMRH